MIFYCDLCFLTLFDPGTLTRSVPRFPKWSCPMGSSLVAEQR
jgi:hypothetical protein